MPRRTVQEVTVQDVQKRRNPNKHYVYIIKVLWSDGSTENIFRRYSKFFDLQMELLDKFPVEGGQKDPKRRIIPFLPGKILFRRSHIRDVAMKRLRPINEYCRALTQLPVYISQCEEVRVFFETRPEDLNPPKEEPIGKKKSGDSTSADPLLLDQYVAVTDYEKQESSEISLHAGQTVEVIEKNESGWWFVSSDDAQGWVPATCLEAQDDPDDFTIPGEEVPRRFWSLPRHVGRRRTLGDLFSTGFGQDEKYSVIYPYAARDEDEIDLERGMVVEMIQKNLEGWWKIRYQGREGWAPASYLKKMDIQSQKQSAGGAAHASTNDLDGFSKQGQPNNAARDKENRLSFFSENKKVGSRHRPPPRRDLTIPRGANLPKPPIPPAVEEEFYTIADFQTTIPDGISFQAGVKVEVIEKNSNGWWYIQIDEKEGWAPANFIDKYKKTSNALRPNFLAPLPNEMEKLRLEDGGCSNASGTDDSWSKPLPDEPPTAPESCARPKLRDWKPCPAKVGSAFPGQLPPAPAAPPVEEKPALPPRRESINKSFELEVADKPRPDHSKPLPPKPPVMPLVPPKAAPFKLDKPPEIKKEDKNKVLHLRNEMGLECGHKISAKEVKKFNLKPVPKQPPKPKPEVQEEKPEAPGPSVLTKPKPVLRPKPVPAAKPDPPAENKLDITNLRSKLRPAKPADSGSASAEANHQNDASAAVNSSHPSCPTSSPPTHIPSLNNTKYCDEPKVPPKHVNGHSHESSSPPAKPLVPPHKEPPNRPPAMAPRRPPPPKKGDPSSPTELKPPAALPEIQDILKAGLPQLSRPPPPKPKGFVPVPANKEKEECKVNKIPIPPKPQLKSEKPGPPKDKLPPLLKEPSRDELYLAVADFEGDEQTANFKVGTVFEVLEKNTSGWWFCKNVKGEVEGWIPSNYLSKKP
ncbi:SH3 and PX domain-containing protein 2B isoform X2 [Hippoglossus hippoglossus]|uniref:SH3 and PX domain-containing protein 2B isoform X2 n=1 Tax=Hippoglossus hippoglossus TaxID=8267 RepID=UPI00148BC22D|nr:SH3 and PX domain-containing protein 2B isoform X2 [Hippoglossus hippoglossus]XP_035033950.1 SH3 and PX domain-containing protein 2B isoform X2 [Hippoglossus stenolepis]